MATSPTHEADGSTVGQAQAKAQEVAAQTQEKAQQAVDQARQQAQQVKGKASGRMREQVDQRSTQAGEQVKSQAGDMRTVAQGLREQGKDQPAKLVEQAADRGERLGSYLQESDADRILNDVEDFARSRPWAVVAGGIALGFAASRFLKASSSDRYNQSMNPASPAYRPAGRAGYDPRNRSAYGGDEPMGPAGYPGTGAITPSEYQGMV